MAEPERIAACALYYYQGMQAPVLIAKGWGLRANKILEIADRYNIAVVKQPELTDELMTLETGAYIPEKVYKVVAGLFVFAQEIKGRI